MADQSETPKILDEIAKKTSAKPGRSKSGRGSLLLLLGLLLPLIGVVAYLGYQQWLLTQDLNQLVADSSDTDAVQRAEQIATAVTELQQQTGLLNRQYDELSASSISTDLDQLRTDNIELNATVAQLTEQSAQLRASLENQSSTLATLQNQNNQLQQIQAQLAEANPEIVIDSSAALEVEQRLITRINQLTAQISALEQQGLSPADNDAGSQLYLSEAEYLLRLANQKLELDGDALSTSAVVQLARQLLIENGGADTELVQQLEQDLLALENVEVVDIESIYQRVNELLPRFNALLLSNSLSQSLPDLQSLAASGQENNETSSNTNGTWSGIWGSSMDFLNSVFVWRRWEESPAVMLPALQDSYTKQNLYLWLEQAKLALLTRNQERYLEAIQNCETWLSHYMVEDDEDSQDLLMELQSLASINIRPQLPAISNSLALVRQLIQ